MVEGRISLADGLQRKWFLEAMTVLTNNRHHLNRYDHDLWQKLSDGWSMVGDSMSLTRKQFNHIRQVAMELEGSGYDGR